MAAFFWSHLSAEVRTIASGVSGKRLRIRRLIVSSAASGAFTFLEDPGGPNQAAILPILQLRAGDSGLDLRFDEEIPQTAPGESLGYETFITAAHGVWVEYDIVDA